MSDGHGFIVFDTGLDVYKGGRVDGNPAKYENAYKQLVLDRICKDDSATKYLCEAGKLHVIVIDSGQVIRDTKIKQALGDTRDFAIIMGEARNAQFLAKVHANIGRKWNPHAGVGDRILRAFAHSYGGITASSASYADKENKNAIFPKGSYLTDVTLLEPFFGEIVENYHQNNRMSEEEINASEYQAVLESNLPKSIENFAKLLKEHTGLDPFFMFAQFGYASVKEAYRSAGIDISELSKHLGKFLGHGFNLIHEKKYPERTETMILFFVADYLSRGASKKFMEEQGLKMDPVPVTMLFSGHDDHNPKRFKKDTDTPNGESVNTSSNDNTLKPVL